MRSYTVKLSGDVDIAALAPALLDVQNTAGHGAGLCLELDCFEVHDFTSLGLAEIVSVRRSLEAHGGGIRLTRCSDWLRHRMVHPAFEALCA